MKTVFTCPLTLCLALFFCTTYARAEESLPAKVEQCVACHGALGISAYDYWPNIGSQKRGYLRKQLLDFRDGSRYDPWMSPIALPLQDTEIDALADFFSRL